MTDVQRLWNKVDELKVLLNENPSIPIEQCRKLVAEIEKIVQQLRKREITNYNI